jgi:hypothetical protein
MTTDPDADQSLRLLKAFAGVLDDKAREAIIALVEAVQRGTRVPALPVDEFEALVSNKRKQ